MPVLGFCYLAPTAVRVLLGARFYDETRPQIHLWEGFNAFRQAAESSAGIPEGIHIFFADRVELTAKSIKIMDAEPPCSWASHNTGASWSYTPVVGNKLLATIAELETRPPLAPEAVTELKVKLKNPESEFSNPLLKKKPRKRNTPDAIAQASAESLRLCLKDILDTIGHRNELQFHLRALRYFTHAFDTETTCRLPAVSTPNIRCLQQTDEWKEWDDRNYTLFFQSVRDLVQAQDVTFFSEKIANARNAEKRVPKDKQVADNKTKLLAALGYVRDWARGPIGAACIAGLLLHLTKKMPLHRCEALTSCDPSTLVVLTRNLLALSPWFHPSQSGYVIDPSVVLNIPAEVLPEPVAEVETAPRPVPVSAPAQDVDSESADSSNDAEASEEECPEDALPELGDTPFDPNASEFEPEVADDTE